MTVLVLVDQQDGAGGNLVLLELAALGIEQRDFAVAGEHDVAGLRRCATTFMRVNLTMPSFLALISLSSTARADRAADVERPHRELRARLADDLGGDDADGHAFFDQRAGRQVHAVARAADAQRGFAGHRAADLDLLQAQLLDLAGDVRRDQLVFVDDHFVGDRVDDVLPADAAA